MCRWLPEIGLVLTKLFLGFGGQDYPQLWFVDCVRVVCIFMLMCCGLVALCYCYHYFGRGDDGGLLFPLIVWFLFVMAALIFSGSIITTLIFWEYLGIVRFFLILFYCNSASLYASLVTAFASRFGDVSLFILFGLFSVVWLKGASGVLVGALLLFVVITKRACFPFISWLLEAMRAPTPVSSLVHSSTLVAAGV